MTRLIDADAIQIRTTSEVIKHIVTDLIDAQPTIDVVPVKRGKWTRENNYGMWKCSVCGCKVNRANPLKGNIWNYNYCPNCGARMDEE